MYKCNYTTVYKLLRLTSSKDKGKSLVRLRLLAYFELGELRDKD